MKIWIINGPNLNLLGLREPEIYGRETYGELEARIRAYCENKGIEVRFVQSNHEGDLVDAVQQAYFDGADGIVLNPAAYTHTGIALLDALRAVPVPAVEVHLSKPEEREEFRRVSYVRAACIKTITGMGGDGYLRAVDALEEHYARRH